MEYPLFGTVKDGKGRNEMAEQYLSQDPNAGLDDQYLSTDPNAGLEPKPEGGIVANALAGAGDVIKGFAQQFVPDLSLKHLATIAYGPINAQIQGYNALKSIVDTGEQIAEADKTPPFSRERFAAGFNVAGQLGLLAAGGRAPKLAEIAGIEKPIEAVPQTPEPLVSEVAAKQTEIIPEAAPKVEEVIPNAEQVQGPARPDVNVQLPSGEVAREVYGGEMPANVGGEGVPEGGQGEALQQTQEVAKVPSEQPTLDELHNKLAVDIVENSGQKDWEEQAVANLIKDGESPKSAQKMVDGWDINARLTYLTDKWKDYWKANPQEFANEYANSFPDEPSPQIPEGGTELPQVGQPKEGGAGASTGSGPVSKSFPADPEMNRWFEGSKVVNEKGAPMIVYHGGPKFEGKFKSPAFFTESAHGASWYAGEKGEGNYRVQPHYLSIKNPLDITTLEGNQKLVKIAQDAGVKIDSDVLDWNPSKEIGWQFQSDEIAKHSPYDGSNPADLVYIPKVREALKKAGYDGLQVSDILERSEIPTWVALDPDQIRPYKGKTPKPITGTQPVEPPAAPPPVPAEAAASDNPQVSRIANRYVEERVASGEIGEIAPGQGYSTQELAAAGLKMSPEEITQHISDLVNKTGDPIKQAEAVRAEESRLSQASLEASKLAEANPNDKALQEAADEAFKNLTDFHNGPVAQAKENFHALGMSMQGELPVDLSTFNGLREQWLKDTGKPPTLEQDAIIKKQAAKVATTISEDSTSRANLRDAIDKATSKRKLPTPEEVQNNIMERMKVEPCLT